MNTVWEWLACVVIVFLDVSVGSEWSSWHRHDQTARVSGDELMSAVKQYVNHQGMQDAQEMVAEMMKDEAKMASTYAGKKTTFSSVASFLGSTPFTKQLSLPASIQIQFLHNVRDKSVSL